MKKVTIFDGENVDSNFLPLTDEELNNWLIKKISEIPAEYRNQAVLDLGCKDEYEDINYRKIKIFYFLPDSNDDR